MEISQLTFNERDEFERRSIAGKIISLLQSDIDLSPLVIDGGWGTGKTEFCHKLINLMTEQDTHHLIYVDAFRADHANEPLMTVLAEVIKVLPEDDDKQNLMQKAIPAARFGLKAFGKAAISHVLRQDSTDVINDFDKEIQKTTDKAIDATVNSILKEHVQAEHNMLTLQNTLTEIAHKKPIVVFVDELDRCRPSFAVEMLEIIKHTFDAEGVNFVLITNKQQLKAAVNHCYGSAVDSQRYLDKFIKFAVTLPDIVLRNHRREALAAVEHYKLLVNKSGILAPFELSECGSVRTVIKFITVNGLSLREVESVVRHMEVYATISGQGCLQKGIPFGTKVLTILAIIIYTIKPELAISIQSNRYDAMEVAGLLGVSKIADVEGMRPEEDELICYMLAKNASYNREPFTPTRNIETWREESHGYFRGAYFSTDDYSSVCAEAIQYLAMS